jgi:hypothetical protein
MKDMENAEPSAIKLGKESRIIESKENKLIKKIAANKK